MNDDPIFTPFQPGAAQDEPPAAETPSKKKTKRKPRKVAAVNAPATPAPPATSTPRKTRAKRGAKQLKMPIAMVASALRGLKAEDGALLEKIIATLDSTSKVQRQRVVAAINELFG